MPRKVPESEDDFIRMQQEAIRRVREMQERARRTLENAGMTIEPPQPVPSHPIQEPAPEPEPFHAPPPFQHETNRESEIRPNVPPPRYESRRPSNPPPPAGRPPLSKNLFNLSLDSDQIMLLLLIYLLYKDGSDNFLILALAYILIT